MTLELWLLHRRKELLVVVAHVGSTKDSLLPLKLGCTLRMILMRCWGSKRIRYHAIAGASTGSLIMGLSMLWDARNGGRVHGIGRALHYGTALERRSRSNDRGTHGPEP